MKKILEEIKGNRQKTTPIWLMRQAGRYMPEYRKIREKSDFLTMCRTPELACEITMQPINKFDMDAAIIFSDILIPLVPMGMDLKFSDGEGPVFNNPVANEKDIENLRVPDTDTETEFLADSLKLVKKELNDSKTLIGFSGAPFTLASYMVEGRGSKNFLKIKTLIYKNPDLYKKLMEKITETVKRYLVTQINAGAEVVQLFDSWGGALSPDDYLKYAHPYSKEIIKFIKKLGTPVIHFVKDSAGFFENLKESDASVFGVDWHINIDVADARLDFSRVLQGNLDPATLFGSREIIKKRAEDILRRAKNFKGHIFNLGHGIIVGTPVDNVQYLVDIVKSYEH